jgi:hypothetical protein
MLRGIYGASSTGDQQMPSIFYIIGVVVVVAAVLGYFQFA